MNQQTSLPGVGAPAAEASARSAFSSRRLRLDRLSSVRRGTAAVVVDAAGRALLKGPGDLLLPAWAPWQPALQVVVLTTEPVSVRVVVEQLLTLDAEDLALVTVDVLVRLDPTATPALVRQAIDSGIVIDAQLRAAVSRSTETSVRAAVGMNRAQDLRRHALAPVLRRWLTQSYADGALLLESFSVVELRWHSLTDDEPGEEPEDYSARLDSRVEAAPTDLTLAPLGREDRHRRARSPAEALTYVHVPALISVGTFCFFFVGYWVPELISLPGAHFWLEQLVPLATKELSSSGQPLVIGQAGHSGLVAALLLVASLLLAPLARSRYWLARLALWPLTYAAAVAAAVAVLEVGLQGRVATELLGLALLVVWVLAAVVTTWRSLWVDVPALPRRPTSVAWLLGLFALLSPAPVALGRAVFAPGLRDGALAVLGNEFSLRWVALLTPATALVYLGGLLLGVLAWAGYLLWPPRRTAHRRRTWIVLLAALVGLVVIGPLAARAAAQRVTEIVTQSPGHYVGRTCGTWTQRPTTGPVRTLVISGPGCQRITSFVGYREVAERPSPSRLSPVHVVDFAGQDVPGRLVAAQYGEVVVVAATSRPDHRADALLGLRLADAAEVWRHPCGGVDRVRLRLGGAGSEQPAGAGRATSASDPGVLVDCGRGVVRLDPRTGHPR